MVNTCCQHLLMPQMRLVNFIIMFRTLQCLFYNYNHAMEKIFNKVELTMLYCDNRNSSTIIEFQAIRNKYNEIVEINKKVEKKEYQTGYEVVHKELLEFLFKHGYINYTSY